MVATGWKEWNFSCTGNKKSYQKKGFSDDETGQQYGMDSFSV
jgi:hypothetical protein